MHGMNGTRNPAHDFIVKLSPCTCSYIAALAGEMAGICGTWPFEICESPAIQCHDKVVNQQAKTLSKPPVNGKWMCM